MPVYIKSCTKPVMLVCGWSSNVVGFFQHLRFSRFRIYIFHSYKKYKKGFQKQLPKKSLKNLLILGAESFETLHFTFQFYIFNLKIAMTID